MSNFYICFGYLPNQFYTIYSVAFLLAWPVFMHLVIYIIMMIFKQDETTNAQVYPFEQNDPTGIDYRVLMSYILIMGLLFDLPGYGPRNILAIIDSQLQKSIGIYAALEILPSVFLLIDICLFFKMNKEVRKKVLSLFGF
jgi:hypothetical protein